jgi:hypothetical protein
MLKLHRNKVIAFSLLLGTVVLFTMTASKDKGAGSSGGSGQAEIDPAKPPIALRTVVRQLQPGEGPNGENMQLKITYDRATISGSSVTLFLDEGLKVTLFDDGRTGKDEVAGDFTFSGFVTEDINAFRSDMKSLDERLAGSNNTLLTFNKRVASLVKRDRPFFDATAFDAFRDVEISKDIFSLQPVTEAPSIRLSGRQLSTSGSYTGGTVPPASSSASIVPASNTMQGYGPPPLPFAIKKHHSLLITDLSVVEDPVRTFNPCTGAGNQNGAWTFKTLMNGLAGGGAAPTTSAYVRNWLNNWMVNQVVNGETVQNRATRMLSQIIKPWLDRARGTTLPTVTAANWQSIWNGIAEPTLFSVMPFKLTAIVNRQDLRNNPGYGGTTNNSGETRFIFSVLKNTAVGCRDSVGTNGFDGMTIIFEYGNVQSTCATIKAFANQWFQLSRPGLILGSPLYLTELQAITNTVTLPNAAPAKGNGSALNQVRTNEIALTNTTNTLNDRSPRWQFREFKIPVALGLQQLTSAPTAQEPATKFNGADNSPAAPLAADVALMANWVNANSPAILNGTYQVPTLIGATNFLAGKVNYPSTSPLVSPGFWNGTAANPIIDDQTRQNFSLGTCTGCHGAEPKTDFTHINYVGLGVSMNYTTTLNFIFSGTQHKTFVSPFLTGVDVIPSGGTFIFGDDSSSVAENATDNLLTGLFYARDPAGRLYPGTTIVRKWGFNDLERRAQDMTNLLHINCKKIILQSLDIAFFHPLNMVH